MLNVYVTNPYHDKLYKTDEVSIKDWNGFIKLKELGTVDVFNFTDTENKSVAINPSNFASVEVWEEITDGE